MSMREGAKLVREARPLPQKTFGSRKFAFIEDFGDFFSCNPYTPDGLSVIPTTTVYVMKPWSLGRTEFDGTGPDAAGISYVYSGNAARLATRGPISEQQRITPDYNDGDVIYAEEVSEVFTIANETQPTTRLIDVNRDARAWAHLDDGGA